MHPLQGHTSIRHESFDAGYNPQGPYVSRRFRPVSFVIKFLLACVACVMAGALGAGLGYFLSELQHFLGL